MSPSPPALSAMHEVISSLAVRVVDAALAAAVVTGLAATAMVLTRQPSRRRALARSGALAAIFVIPMVAWRPFAPLDLLSPVREAFEGVHGPNLPAWANLALGSLPDVLLGAYLAGVVMGAGRLALGGFGAGWIRRHSRRASDESRALFETLPSTPGRRRPALRVSDRTTRPVLLGAFRPTILIPPDLDRPEAADALRLALFHELAHAEASDPWFGLVLELASVLWFWLPPVRWIAGQARLDQEFLADRHAADRLGPSTARYASGLVEIAASRDRPSSAGRARAPGGGSALLQRVLMLVRCPFAVESLPPLWWRALLGLATVSVVVLSAGLTLRARAQPGPAASQRSVTIASLVLDTRDPEGPPTSLPVRLPPEFDLTFEVVVPSDDLATLEVLGHPLPHAGEADDPDRPHRVALRRRLGTLSIGLDDGPLAELSGTSDEGWLTARASAGLPITLRSIRLAW